MDDKTLHEMYLLPFYHVVEAGTASIMCAYSKYYTSFFNFK